MTITMNFLDTTNIVGNLIQMDPREAYLIRRQLKHQIFDFQFPKLQKWKQEELEKALKTRPLIIVDIMDDGTQYYQVNLRPKNCCEWYYEYLLEIQPDNHHVFSFQKNFTKNLENLYIFDVPRWMYDQNTNNWILCRLDFDNNLVDWYQNSETCQWKNRLDLSN